LADQYSSLQGGTYSGRKSLSAGPALAQAL